MILASSRLGDLCGGDHFARCRDNRYEIGGSDAAFARCVSLNLSPS